MRFLIDAQLPRRMARWLADEGHDAIHTLDLPKGNRTTDIELIAVALREMRILVTKDDDFVRSFLLKGQPARLLLINTGNIGNRELEALMRGQLTQAHYGFRVVIQEATPRGNRGVVSRDF